MTFTLWKNRLFEDEDYDIEDQFDDTEIDNTDDYRDTPLDTLQIKSMVSSMVSSEVNKLTKGNSVGDSHSDISEDKKTDVGSEKDDTPSIVPERPINPKHSDNRQHTPIPHHSSNSGPISFPTRHSKKPHRRGVHKGHKGTTNNPKVRSKPHHNYVFKRLGLLFFFPQNHNPLVRFCHHIKGNYIIFSPIIGNETPDIQMKKILWLRRLLIENGYKYLPIYTFTKDNEQRTNKLIDISLILFPKGKMGLDYLKLTEFIDKVQSNLPRKTYIGCEDGFFTLYTDKKTIHYTYEDIDKIMDNYTKDRDIPLQRKTNHYLNPVPQSEEERDYRTGLGEVCMSYRS